MQLDCVSFQNCRPCKRGGAAVPTVLALSGLSSVRTFETHSSRHLRVPSCLSLLREHVHSTRPGAMDRVDDRSHRRVAPLSIPRPGAPPAVLPESSPRNGIPADCQLEVCVYQFHFAVAVLKSPEGAKRVGSKSITKRPPLPTSCTSADLLVSTSSALPCLCGFFSASRPDAHSVLCVQFLLSFFFFMS